MRHYFVFDGKSSLDFGAYIADSNLFDGAERDVTTVDIPGRSGSLTLDNGRYKNISATVTVYIPKDMLQNVPALRNYLCSRSGYCRYEDTMHPGEVRYARFTGGFRVKQSDRVGAAVDLTFDCKPQRYLTYGEAGTVFTTSGILYNGTAFDALPKIIVYGSAGTVTIGGVTVGISGITGGSAVIDCEAMEVPGYNGSTTLTDGEFPRLTPGDNQISFTGFSRIEIIPRWWTV